jgi:PEP-CTERM motif
MHTTPKLVSHHLAATAALIMAALANTDACAGVNPDTIMAKAGEVITVYDPAGSGRQASLLFLGGTGTLNFSNGGILDTGLLPSGAKPSAVGGLVGALNTGKVVLTSVDGAAITEKAVTLSSTRTPRGIVSIGATVSSMTANGRTGVIGLVSATGGATQTAPFIEGTLDGGQMTVNNLQIDLANKLVYADMAYKALQLDGSYGPLVSNPHVPLWTIGTVSGPTVIPPSGLLKAADGDFSEMLAVGYQQASVTPKPGGTPASWTDLYTITASNLLTELRVTPEGFGIFAAGLGLAPGSIGYDALDGVNAKAGGWGSMTSTVSFAYCYASNVTPCPEPATYALMGLGLVGIGAATKRQKASGNKQASA